MIFDYDDAYLKKVYLNTEILLEELGYCDLLLRYKESKAIQKEIDFKLLIPLAAYDTVGGKDIESTIFLSSAFDLLMCAARIFDDIQDQDNELDPLNIALTPAQRMMNGLLIVNLAYYCISKLESLRISDFVQFISSTMGVASFAQFEETKTTNSLNYSENLTSKTSLLLGCMAGCGALLGTNNDDWIVCLKVIGEKIGFLMQLVDDVIDGDQYSNIMEEFPTGLDEVNLPKKLHHVKHSVREEILNLLRLNNLLDGKNIPPILEFIK